jgi:hypothetical protein
MKQLRNLPAAILTLIGFQIITGGEQYSINKLAQSSVKIMSCVGDT